MQVITDNEYLQDLIQKNAAGKADDVVAVVRCGKCKWWDPDSEYCQFWHGVRHPGHYCGEGERK